MTEHPYVAPPVDGLRLAMADARGRRYRSAGLSSATVGTALVAVLAVLGGSGTQSLVEQPAPEQPAVTQLVPGPAGDQTSRQNTVGAVSSTGQITAAGLRPTGADSGITGQAARPDTAARTSSSSFVGPRTTAPMRLAPGNPSTIDACPVNKTTSGQASLCPAGLSRTYDNQGNPLTGALDLVTSVCSYDTRALTLHFTTTNEADVAVLDSKRHVLWRWSVEHAPVASPHTLAMGTGDCWEWSTVWAGVNQAGRPLPAGNYTLRLTSYVRELGSQNVVETPLQL